MKMIENGNIGTEKRQKLKFCKETIARKTEVACARARCVPSSKLCCKLRGLAFHYAEYYVSFDADVLFAFLANLWRYLFVIEKRKTKVPKPYWSLR
jgi:hypothetical protein